MELNSLIPPEDDSMDEWMNEWKCTVVKQMGFILKYQYFDTL